MAQSIEEKNEALVNKAFDTLFHKRDYEAAERLWSPATFGTALISNPGAVVCST
jgi:hypothetical protein